MNLTADASRILRNINFQRSELDILVLKTPTSEERNKLSEASIYLSEVSRKLEEVLNVKS